MLIIVKYFNIHSKGLNVSDKHTNGLSPQVLLRIQYKMPYSKETQIEEKFY